MRVVILPYGDSESVRLLKSKLKVPVVSSYYRPAPEDLVVNWGSASGLTHDRPDVRYLNHPSAIRACVDKIETFKRLESAWVSVPLWTESASKARTWLACGMTIYARKYVDRSGGKGIKVCTPGSDEIPDGYPLYTVLVPIVSEYRVHVFKDRVIHVQKKEGGDNLMVRTRANGWKLNFTGADALRCVELEAIKAVKAMGLDFGAVDCCYSADGRPVVFEVNTAPGVQKRTKNRYAEAIKEYASGT